MSATAESMALLHSPACPRPCPVCLGADLRAKEDAVRERIARLAESMAAMEPGPQRKSAGNALRRLARKVRDGMSR